MNSNNNSSVEQNEINEPFNSLETDNSFGDLID